MKHGSWPNAVFMVLSVFQRGFYEVLMVPQPWGTKAVVPDLLTEGTMLQGGGGYM